MCMFVKAFAQPRGGKAGTKGGDNTLRRNLKKNTNMNNRQIGQAVRRARKVGATIQKV